METEDTENEQLMKKSLHFVEFPQKHYQHLGNYRPLHSILNNLWMYLSKKVKNLKADRVWRWVSIFIRYHSFFFSFNIAKIS